jgi:hypothetical protein
MASPIESTPAPLADIVSNSTFAVELDVVSPLKVKSGEEALSVRVVLVVPAPTVPPPVLGVPVPVMSIPTPEIVIPVVHVHDPGGMMIVSPFTAVCVGPLMTALTSDWLHVLAV